MSEPGRPRGVIHDLGYRSYAGPRLEPRRVWLSLYLTGLRNAFGLGRSGKSKVLPFGLLALNLFPAVIIVTVLVVTRLPGLPLEYPQYALTTSVLTGVFAAAQGPVLFSRDLRHGSIALYLARPLGAAAYVLARWTALATAIWLFVLAPLVIMYLGAVLADLDLSTQTGYFLRAILVVAILAAMLASVSGVFSAFALRRGFAVVGTITTVLFGYGVISAIQAVAYEQDSLDIAQIAGLLHPMSLYAGLGNVLGDADTAIVAPEGALMSTLYVVVSLLLALGGLGLLTRRYRKVATR